MTGSGALALPNWLDVAARNHPGRLALTFGAQRWTFTDLARDTRTAAARLAPLVAERGGRIGILSANCPEFVLAVHAAAHLGIPYVPLNWRQSAMEIAWQLRDASISVLVVDEPREAVAARASAGLDVSLLPIRGLAFGATLPASTSRTEPRVLGVPPWITLSHEAAVIYTSGTSGRPKGARITFGNLWFNAVASALHLGHHDDDIWLAAMPLFHIGGLSILYRGIIGASQVKLHDRFDPDAFFPSIDDGATLVSVVPAMLQRLLDARGDTPWPRSLRRVLVGGSASPPELLSACVHRGIPVAPTYGLTEASSQVATLLPEQAADRTASSGRPLPLTEVRIAGASNNVDTDVVGEIELRGPTIFAGYLNQDRDVPTHTRDGWFQTGDIGYLDQGGFLHVVDRRSDLIVSGGENIYPAEVERALCAHPRVLDAGVVAMPIEDWGARPLAAVVWSGDPDRAEIDLRRHCDKTLARYKIPDRFVLVDSLPRSPSGKLLRGQLRETMLVEPEQQTDAQSE